jgi:hypothetical protein
LERLSVAGASLTGTLRRLDRAHLAVELARGVEPGAELREGVELTGIRLDPPGLAFT